MSTAPLADAYSATGGAWQRGPGRIYDRLATMLVDACPCRVTGGSALDVGAGTGAASRALAEAGAAGVVACDIAAGMLAWSADVRPAGVAADATQLPFRDGSFDAVVAAFSLNHLADPARGLVEARRVARLGGGLVASAYAEDDDHPVKAAVERACRDWGWQAPAWMDELRRDAAPRLATVERATAVAADAGLAAATVEQWHVPFPELDGAALVAWRLGMAAHAPFVASLPPADQAAIAAAALASLGPDAPPLVRSIIVITAIA